MRKLVIFLPILLLNMLCGIAGGSAQDASAMKATAPEKMMPKNQAAKMRACDKRAMDQNIKMEDRARFVENASGARRGHGNKRRGKNASQYSEGQANSLSQDQGTVGGCGQTHPLND